MMFTDKLHHIKMYQVHLQPATIHWQILSYQTISSTPLICHNSLTNSITSNWIKDASYLPQFIDKFYHIKMYQVHCWPATIHWQTLSHKDVSTTPLTCNNSLTNSYYIQMYQLILWPATIHWQILSQKDVSSTLLTCNNSLTNSIT